MENKMKKTNQSGSALLIEMLVVCAIALVFLSMPAIYATKLLQANNQSNVVTELRRINLSESWFWRVYSPNGYETPQYLANAGAGNIGAVAAQNCNTPGLLGAEAASIFVTGTYSGYNWTFTPGPTSPTQKSGCNAAGFTTYTITATPISTANGKYSYFTDQTMIIRFAPQGQTASASSPIW